MRETKQNPLRVVINPHAHRHFTVDEVFIGFVLGVCGFASAVRWPPVAMRGKPQRAPISRYILLRYRLLRATYIGNAGVDSAADANACLRPSPPSLPGA